MMHEDTRYYTLGKGDFASGWATHSRALWSRVTTTVTILSISAKFWEPARFRAWLISTSQAERTLTKTYQRWVTNLAIDGCTFAFKEVWPDINNALFHQQD